MDLDSSSSNSDLYTSNSNHLEHPTTTTTTTTIPATDNNTVGATTPPRSTKQAPLHPSLCYNKQALKYNIMLYDSRAPLAFPPLGTKKLVRNEPTLFSPFDPEKQLLPKANHLVPLADPTAVARPCIETSQSPPKHASPVSTLRW